MDLMFTITSQYLCIYVDYVKIIGDFYHHVGAQGVKLSQLLAIFSGNKSPLFS